MDKHDELFTVIPIDPRTVRIEEDADGITKVERRTVTVVEEWTRNTYRVNGKIIFDHRD